MANIRALVLAEVNRQMIEAAFPMIDFDYRGYSVDFNVLNHEKLHDIIFDYEILISEFDTIDQYVIDNAKKLKLIVCCRGGVRTVVDIPYANAHGIIVQNTPGRNADAVSEYVIGQIISEDRYLNETNELIHRDELQKKVFSKPKEYRDSLWGMDKCSPYHVYRGRGLSNISLGIIGFGMVGKNVAEKAKSLGFRKVLVYDHHEHVCTSGIEFVTYENLLMDSDIVSLHCTNPTHRAMLSYAEFNMMKTGSWLINTARGDLIDENALIDALNSGHLGKAILDVTENEPLAVNSRLLSAKNLRITPHIAGATDSVIDIGTLTAINHIREYLDLG